MEIRAVLNASASINAAGLLTVDVGSPDMMTLTIEVADGGYRLSSPYYNVDLVENAASLPTEGSGTMDLWVAGITGLTVNANWDATLNLISSDVPTTMNARYDSVWITLGGDYGTEGIKGITAPVVVDAAYDLNQPSTITNLKLMDRGSQEPTDYTIGSDSITSTGGFGGLSYRGLDAVEVVGASAYARFYVRGTHAGRTTLTASGEGSDFDVDAAVGPDERPPLSPWYAQLVTGGESDMSGRLVLVGLVGDNTFNVERTPTDVRIIPCGRQNVVNLTRDGSTAGITHDVVIGADYPSGWVSEVVVDDSAETVERNATYAALDHAVVNQDDWVGASVLRGAAAEDAQIQIMPHLSGTVLYKAPKDLANTMTVDLEDRSPLPEGAFWNSTDVGAFSYDGGYTGGSDTESRLKVVGLPIFWGWPTDSPFSSELSIADGSGSGSLAFAHESGIQGMIAYAGLSPMGLLDLAPVTDYRLDYRGAADPGVAITAVESTVDGLQAMLIASKATPAAFVGTTIANKANVTVVTNGTGDISTSVDYESVTPVAGLERLSITTSANDQVDVAAPPPGVSVAISIGTGIFPRPPKGSDDTERPDQSEPSPPDSIEDSPAPVQEGSGDTAQAPASAPPTQTVPSLPPAPVASVSPTEPAPVGTAALTQPDAPPAQVVGADRVLRFKTAMRTRTSSRASVDSASPFRNLRAARMAHLEALQTQRLERRWAARASLSH